jgi:hypothetical protein
MQDAWVTCAGERAGMLLAKNAGSASQAGLNGRHHIPERHPSRPLQPHFMIGLVFQHFLGNGRKAVRALRSDWRDAGPLWRRAASAADRGSSHSRHERLQYVGGVRGPATERMVDDLWTAIGRIVDLSSQTNVETTSPPQVRCNLIGYRSSRPPYACVANSGALDAGESSLPRGLPQLQFKRSCR